MSNQSLIKFDNEQFGKIRALLIDGEPWFVGKDIAVALGYKNTKDALSKHVPAKYKRGSQITTPSGTQKMTLINEAGLYKLVFKSKLPSAENFSDWVCEEVLPSIRKTGSYSIERDDRWLQTRLGTKKIAPSIYRRHENYYRVSAPIQGD